MAEGFGSDTYFVFPTSQPAFKGWPQILDHFKNFWNAD